MSKKLSACKSLKNNFNGFDLFGYKITLNYKSKEEYQTTAGAFFSILLRAFVLWFLSLRLGKLLVWDPNNDKIDQ